MSKEIVFPLQDPKFPNGARRMNIYNSLKFQRIPLNSFGWHDKPYYPHRLNVQNAFLGIQASLIMSTAFKNHAKVIWMVPSLARMSKKIIQVWIDNILDVMEGKFHFLVKGSSDIFQIEGHFLVQEGTPRKNKSCFYVGLLV